MTGPRALLPRSVGLSAAGALAVAAGLLASGCGPIEYFSQVTGRAATAVDAAKAADAETLAPYEYTAAVEYLHKAREEAGHAEYGVSIDLGRRAEESATRARAIADEKRRRGQTGDETAGAAASPPRPSSSSSSSSSNGAGPAKQVGPPAREPDESAKDTP